ncbi:breast carcinoma-amplified sequence 1 isoform X2 [Myxocyprinus asiaticus]|uniref:breast carcinoma-amplified sequence 1 isoform X2 n=1 Tax=Myxocyprinus asiaticus TaxID=70543 RepID=UPI002223A9B2|nr:breast carcinoma-amplified sequence 1 isoform X2 [Myxocyprinus asiaticus]
MGNEQSTQRKRQKANTVEKNVQNGEMNGHAVPPPDSPEPVASKEAVVQQKCEIPPETDVKNPEPSAGKEEVDSNKANKPAHVETTPEKETTAATDAEPKKEAQKLIEKEVTNIFGKMFKKKSEPVKSAAQSNAAVDGQVKVADLKIDLQTESVDIKTSTESEPEPKEKTLESILVEVAEEIYPSEDIKEAEKTVMNFFKTFVNPTKTSKEAKATPDASKDQPQKETPPAPSTNEVPKAPPPPPPAPPKMENKAEPVVKKEETPAAAATKASDSSTKTKPKDSAFSKLFRPKPVVVGEKKPVEVQQQVDASKTSTLEAAAKPEEPPAPKPEEKKKEKKSTIGMFKPKVLLSQLSTRIQAAASSAAASITLAAGSAPEPKKETPAAPAVVEVAPAVKAKEEPKPATPAPPAAPDNKSVASSANASPNIPRKLEKRNSMQLFFKNLGQKRHSDAGVQTDPVAPEKAK